jgi:hypothetical protein
MTCYSKRYSIALKEITSGALEQSVPIYNTEEAGTIMGVSGVNLRTRHDSLLHYY